ncbi:hypothetical protein DID88_002966 [Monilinia fructigena]|uniref:Uncharacterized protein n=1 Tax=Monilinia fructigena TaxID=38457 RepID=A0A395IR79_9HELO|nr:hypothetical protein DID88_002966 [Monilinia fructigena]
MSSNLSKTSGRPSMRESNNAAIPMTTAMAKCMAGKTAKMEEDGDAKLLKPVASNPDDFASLILEADQRIKQQPDSTEQYVKLLNHFVSPSAISNPGKVAYLQEKSSLALLIKDHYGTTDAVHTILYRWMLPINAWPRNWTPKK